MGRGESSARDVSETMIEVATSIINQVTLDCRTTVSQRNLLDVIIDPDSQVEVGDINIGGRQTVGAINIQCLQDVVGDTELTQELQTEATQQADAIIEDLNIGFNSSEAETIRNLTEEIFTTVQQVSVQQCGTNLEATNVVHATIEGQLIAANVNVGTAQELADQIINCTQTSQQVVDLQQQLEDALVQAGMARVTGINIPEVFRSIGDAVGSILGGWFGGIIGGIVVVLIVLVVLGLGIFFLIRAFRGKPQQPQVFYPGMAGVDGTMVGPDGQPIDQGVTGTSPVPVGRPVATAPAPTGLASGVQGLATSAQGVASDLQRAAQGALGTASGALSNAGSFLGSTVPPTTGPF